MTKSFYIPLPSNISYWWNFGSLLGACLVSQITTGIFLSMFYENNMEKSFQSVNSMMRNLYLGWMIRSLHANGASMFFIMVYLHIGRGMFFKSFLKKPIWLTGSMILVLLMATAFIGYVLPWGQMSFWGATVITNLLTSIPFIGKDITVWIWGNFSVSKSTLMRFFTFHFLLPLIMIMLATLHMIFLHKYSSSNPLGVKKNLDKIPFQPFFSLKDFMSLMLTLMLLMYFSLAIPYNMMDPDNFTSANPLSTPAHIQPEWYFLFAYAILRSIPNKLGGVIALLMSIMMMFILPFMSFKKKNYFFLSMIYKTMFFMWTYNAIYLTMIGSMPIETPFESISKILSIVYFSFFAIYL